MKLRSNRFLLITAAFTVFIFLMLSMDCRPAFAASAPATKESKKTTSQTSSKPDAIMVTFVEIGAAKCIPCKAMQPIMKAVEEEYRGQVKVVFHDVWTPKGRDDAEKYNIRIIPTQVFLDKDGKEYFRHEGYFPKEELVKVIKMQGVR